MGPTKQSEPKSATGSMSARRIAMLGWKISLRAELLVRRTRLNAELRARRTKMNVVRSVTGLTLVTSQYSRPRCFCQHWILPTKQSELRSATESMSAQRIVILGWPISWSERQLEKRMRLNEKLLARPTRRNVDKSAIPRTHNESS